MHEVKEDGKKYMGFRQEITRSLGKVLKQNDYKMEPMSVDCIYFIKRYSDELAFYTT